ncbi:DUF2628 domain-containing protein [Leptospira stimsonii]|uniref:DUF2628 domain-containing protein n=1 Tax=Leptospira stimsonii TaxID=2202203 RepID=A0A4R9L3Z3_9LEPT|nr:DUF2628 domain-containing protein [Leptospira stimsonii]RHX82987.1 hypothetical protein DLM78_23360 [Leptospira stimsonii]TGK19102.1 DUF2628 domain-containing protein [Leptospira stimsonii]TGM13060.1 DUF2628 domain-containing protein [Leptospira stimsonii]
MKGKGKERLESLLNGFEKDQNREFIGNQAEYYFKKWGKMKKSSSSMKIYSWNWAAILLGPIWYSYRKMYLISIVYYALIVGASIVATYFFEKEIPNSAFGGGSLIFGLMGNFTYLDFISKKTQKIEEDSKLDEMEKLEECKKQGRTNVGAAVLAGLPILIGMIFEIVK